MYAFWILGTSKMYLIDHIGLEMIKIKFGEEKCSGLHHLGLFSHFELFFYSVF
jgi:hypothetical protein